MFAIKQPVPVDADTLTLLNACTMIGDVNMFLSQRYDDNDDDAPPTTWGELEIMIAEPAWRRKGLAQEALKLLLHYITTSPTPHPTATPRASSPVCTALPIPKEHLFVRVSMYNTPSMALFEKLGFVRVKENAVFEEVELGLPHEASIVCATPRAILAWPEA